MTAIKSNLQDSASRQSARRAAAKPWASSFLKTIKFTFAAGVGALLGTNALDAGVPVGSSTLIGKLQYSDSFTITPNGGIPGRPGGGAYPVNSPGINVENNYVNPPQVWSNGKWSIAEDATVNTGGAPYVGSGAGTDTGMTQTGGGNDYGLEYGLANQFVVQFDAFQAPDRINIGARSARDTIGGSGLTVFFRTLGAGFPQIGLYNGASEIDSGLTSGIDSANTWHNYAVRFDMVNSLIEVYVDQVSRGVVNLATLNGGSHNTINNAAVNVGGTPTSNRFWSDNFQVGLLMQLTTTALNSAPNPSTVGGNVVFTATVETNGAPAGDAAGSVVFKESGTPLSTNTVSSGVASFSISTLGVGSHVVTAEYSGGGVYLPSASFPALTHVVQAPSQKSTTTALTSAPNPSLVGGSVTLTASVQTNGVQAGLASGSVVFLDGLTPLSTNNVVGGVAVLTSSALTFGSHAITAQYSGDPAYSASASTPPLAQIVQGPTTTRLVSSANPSLPGNVATFTATVQTNGVPASGATGWVVFKDGGAVLVTSPVLAGGATFPTSALVLGSHEITAEYSGDTFHLPSTNSAPLVQVVEKRASIVLSTDIMLNGGAPAWFVDGNGSATGVEIVHGGGAFQTAVPYTSIDTGPTVDLTPYNPGGGGGVPWLGADIYNRQYLGKQPLYTPGDGETPGNNNGGIGFGGHAPWLITFDLDAIRATRLTTTDLPLRLTGRYGQEGGTLGGSLGVVFVDGQVVFESGLKTVTTPSDPIDLLLAKSSRWLTFVVAAGADGNGWDDGTFRDMRLSANRPPTVAVTDPSDGAQFTAPATFDFTADATAPDGIISRVQFYVGAALVGTATTAPYTVPVTWPYPGRYTLTTAATDDLGRRVVSAPVSILIASSEPPVPVTDGLQLWLAADSGFTTNGSGGVATWADQSPNHNDATEITGPRFVPSALNGKPVFHFNGVNNVMQIANSASLQPGMGDWTVFVVAKRGTASQGDYPQIIGSRPWTAGLDKGWAIAFSSVGVIGSHYADGTAGHDVPAVQATNSLSTTAFQVWQIEENRTAGTTAFYSNGSPNRVLLTPMPTAPIDQANLVYIGREMGGSDSRRANMDLAEVIIYNRVLPLEERNAVGDYLSAKYALGFVANLTPTVAIISPTDGASFTTADTFDFTAAASDPDGSISQVEFYVGEMRMAIATQAPFTVPVKILNPGTFVLTAAATDNRGERVVSAPVSVIITGESPAPPPPDINPQLWLAADAALATDADGFVTYWVDQSPNMNDAFQSTGGAAGFAPLFVPNAFNGKPALRFDGADDYLQIQNSDSIRPGTGDWTVFFVGQRRPGSQGDWPQIIGSRPWTDGLDQGWGVAFNSAGLIGSHYADGTAGHDVGSSYNSGAQSSSSFSQSSVQVWQVEENRRAGTSSFYLDGLLDRAMFSVMPTNAIDQTNSVYIGREIDGSNNRRASLDLAEVIIFGRVLDRDTRDFVTLYLSDKYGLPFTLSQNLPPTVEITSPSQGDRLAVPNNLTLTASASDNDGSVASVQFFSGATLLGTVTNAPYILPVTNTSPGVVTYTAIAADNLGATTVSSPVTITNLSTIVIPSGNPDLITHPGAATISIPSAVGFSYRLLYTESLAPTAVQWIEVAPGVQTGTGSLLQWVDHGTFPQRFYRVEVIHL